MRKLQMKMSMSLDGFVGGIKGENDWIFKSSTAESKEWVLEVMRAGDLLIMGRKSFEEMSPYWPTASGPFAATMNELPKAVFSRKEFRVKPVAASPEGESWAQARVFSGDLIEGITRLKQEPGKAITALGGAGFMRSLISTGLVDEFHLAIHPVVLGAGLPIFTGLDKSLDLKLINSKAFSGGVVVHSYVPA